MLSRWFASIVPSFDSISVFFYIGHAIRIVIESGFIGKIITMATSKILDTGTKIEFCHLFSTVNTIFKERTLKEVALSSVMAGEGNDWIFLFDVVFFVCPAISDDIGEFQIRIRVIISNLDYVADAVFIST